jgi:hypothetical protein
VDEEQKVSYCDIFFEVLFWEDLLKIEDSDRSKRMNESSIAFEGICPPACSDGFVNVL